MLCYLIKRGHIQGVVLLKDGQDDNLIQQAEAILREWAPGAEGVEVWSGMRFVYRSPTLPISN